MECVLEREIERGRERVRTREIREIVLEGGRERERILLEYTQNIICVRNEIDMAEIYTHPPKHIHAHKYASVSVYMNA